MDELTDEELKNRIVFGKSELVTEPLNGEPYQALKNKTLSIIKFGNTGFKLTVKKAEDNSYATFDFLPEDRILPDPKYAAKHASILGYSLFKFYKFINQPEKMQEFGVDDSNITTISAVTNVVMIDAISNLFERNNHNELSSITDVNNTKTIKIDWQKFKALKPDDPLIQYLERLSARANDSTVTYLKTIENP